MCYKKLVAPLGRVSPKWCNKSFRKIRLEPATYELRPAFCDQRPSFALRRLPFVQNHP